VSLTAADYGFYPIDPAAKAAQALPGGPLFGFTPQNFTRWRRGLARVRSGASDAKLLVCSDSTGAGTGGGTSPLVLASWPSRLAVALDEVPYLTAARGLGVPPTNIGSDPDTRWTAGAGWTKTGVLGFGGGSVWQATNPAGSLVYADTILADRFDVYYARNTSLGTLGITATGGSVVNQSTAGTQGVGVVTVSAASAATDNTVTITGSGGGTYVLGVEPWLSGTRRVRVGNASVPSSSTVNWVASSTTYGAIPTLKAYAPDLTIICLGINDGRNSVAPATFTANMQALIAAAQTSGDVIAMTPVPCRSDANAPLPANQPAIIAAALALGVPTADWAGRWVSGDAANTLGYMADAFHPNALGYAEVVQLLAPALAAV
jgi:hypothetical protein